MADSDCTSTEPRPLMSVDEAIDFLLSHVDVINESESLPSSNALGRVLADPVKSSVNVPPWNNSAMDGYAFNASDVEQGKPLSISQRIAAGESGEPLAPGSVARIFTGAPMPADADTVVMQEHCTASEQQVTIDKMPDAGANVRLTGEDVAVDQVVIDTGTVLQPQHLGARAARLPGRRRRHQRRRQRHSRSSTARRGAPERRARGHHQLRLTFGHARQTLAAADGRW